MHTKTLLEMQCDGKNTSLESEKLSSRPSSAFSSCVTLGKLPNLSGSQFIHLKNANNKTLSRVSLVAQ